MPSRSGTSQGNSLTGGPVAGNAFYQDFEGTSCQAFPGIDVIVLYDQLADRWIWTSLEGDECVAVSMSGDPLGAYYLYDFQYPFGNIGGRLSQVRRCGPMPTT